MLIPTLTDSRVTERFAMVNGRRYRYIHATPISQFFIGTIFLIHGWPDLADGWRYQIPELVDLGYRVIAPDMMGYGGTDAPHVPPESLAVYGLKQAANDIAELARQLEARQIILGGHDWGGAVVWRTAQWKPELVSAVFVICTPFAKQRDEYIPLEMLVKGPLPQFGYQLQFAGPDLENAIKSKHDMRNLLKGVYGGKGLNGEIALDPLKGVIFENVDKLQMTPLLSEEELDYYSEQYTRKGLHGPLNWYRTREVNFREELELRKESIDVPALFIPASRDAILKPAMARGMHQHIPKLKVKEVDAGHWAQLEKKEEVTDIIKQWLNELRETKSSL